MNKRKNEKKGSKNFYKKKGNEEIECFVDWVFY